MNNNTFNINNTEDLLLQTIVSSRQNDLSNSSSVSISYVDGWDMSYVDGNNSSSFIWNLPVSPLESDVDVVDDIDYDENIRRLFIVDEPYREQLENCLMMNEDKLTENDLYYYHHLKLNTKLWVDNNDSTKLILEKDRETFVINCEKVHIQKSCCSICGEKCRSRRCRGEIYDDIDEDEYVVCDLFPSYLESLLFFKILCQSIKYKEIKRKKYNFKINKLLILKLYKNINNKIDSNNILVI
jgi:hypothetical protein